MPEPEDQPLALARTRERQAVGVVSILSAALLAYFVAVGGTEAGVIVPSVRIANTAISAILIAIWIIRIRESDLIDGLVLIALVAFLVACVFAVFPRPALDAATSAAAFVAAFFLSRRLLSTHRTRRLFLNVLAYLGVALAVGLALVWGSTWLTWLQLTGFTLWPPLGMQLPASPFRHVHIAALCLVLLVPAMFTLQHRVGRLMATIGTISTAFVVIASGSRTVWTAAAIATVISLTASHKTLKVPRFGPRSIGVGAAAGMLLFVALFTTGAAQSLINRLTTLQTLGARGEIWQGSFQLFAAHPIVGGGPGAFPAVLATTGYFSDNSFAPRHADSLYVQLLAETGVVGVAVLLMVGLLLARQLFQSRAPWQAVWVPSFFLLASFTDNPSDSAGLVLLLVVWLGFGLPRSPEAFQWRARLKSPLLLASVSLAGAIASAYLLIAVALVANEIARDAADRGDSAGAAKALDLAIATDPAFALYYRERGNMLLEQRRPDLAAADYEKALRLNAVDDTTMRALAVARSLGADPDGAVSMAASAIAEKPSDQTNLLLLAHLEFLDGKPRAASEHLATVLQLNPLLPAAPQWRTMFPTGDELTLLQQTAVAEWSETTTFTRAQLATGPATLLDIVGNNSEKLRQEAMALAPSVARSLQSQAALFSCERAIAVSGIVAASQKEADSSHYWRTRVLISSTWGSDPIADRLAALFSPSLGERAVTEQVVVDEAQDRRLYSRIPIPTGFMTGIPTGGFAYDAWRADPIAAARIAAPLSQLADCSR